MTIHERYGRLQERFEQLADQNVAAVTMLAGLKSGERQLDDLEVVVNGPNLTWAWKPKAKAIKPPPAEPEVVAVNDLPLTARKRVPAKAE